ncbi:bifunctional cytidylyltransferase/SDR family oxidoreductase [Aequorivita xiaoshiensis]|uniref:2-C-methyl-D-erythritol 4-phosphate cytidylyltransferase n=1 Tax=Aequorivita xiaoshiensis TaxID=2874476 RepID=A0A9X1R3N2_9FLAO|nr:bifunctional cytidylyltransferase/SDR family oxidoreductase [Aequorivita xiaoshiensis]MCG2431666.1 bifunctional cytidylyltransferase/SDR family oxidoreductase [Aequorivita xiaoshiensis]
MTKNVAVILAGGKGSRMQMNFPKQFLKVAGKTILEHTVQAFQNNINIDEIVIVSNSIYISQVESFVLLNNWTKVKKILTGGEERYESSLSAIKAYEGTPNVNLIFHDSVRPLVSDFIIDNVIQALKKYSAVNTAIPSADTIIQLKTEHNIIKSIPERKYLRRGQTPQAFKYDIIKKAYDLALKDPNFKTTDDCGVVLKYLPEVEIYVVPGEENNFKLTYKEDSFLLDKLFQLKTTNFYTNPDLSEIKDKVIVVFGGGSGIGEEIVSIAKELGAKVYPFSRSLNNTEISNPVHVAEALQMVVTRESKIDFVINTAAVLTKEALVHMEAEKIDEALNTNLKGVICIARESHFFLKNSNGHLLNFTSSSYTRGRSFYSVYSATKAAVVNFTQALAEEWSPDNIQVNCINPERTNTPMRVSNFGHEPLDSLLSANEVAKISLGVLLSKLNGQVVDIKKKS